MLTQSIHTNDNHEDHELILNNLKYSKPQLTNQFWTENYQKPYKDRTTYTSFTQYNILYIVIYKYSHKHRTQI